MVLCSQNGRFIDLNLITGQLIDLKLFRMLEIKIYTYFIRRDALNRRIEPNLTAIFSIFTFIRMLKSSQSSILIVAFSESTNVDFITIFIYNFQSQKLVQNCAVDCVRKHHFMTERHNKLS